MSDINDEQQSEVVRITGGDEQYVAAVIQEDGQNKLLVKSSIVPQVLGNRFTRYAEDVGSNDMNVNGSGTPVDFIVDSDASGDMIISSLIFEAIDGGIQNNKFLGKSAEITTGVVVEVKSQDVVFQFLPIRNTIEFDSLFSHGQGRSFEVIYASGKDSMVSRFGPSTPFLLKQTGTYVTDDYIKVTIQDNLNNVTRFRFLAEGNLDI